MKVLVPGNFESMGRRMARANFDAVEVNPPCTSFAKKTNCPYPPLAEKRRDPVTALDIKNPGRINRKA
jgi:hypothetical protein